MSATTEITLALGAGSIKKLRALAMLTGKTVDEVEADLSETFDRMLSANIKLLVSQLDGDDEPAHTELAPLRKVVETKNPAARSFAQAEAEANDPLPVEEAAPDEHSLSGDDDVGENKSLEEQAADGTLTQADLPSIGEIPDAGDNAEAYLEAAFRSERTHLPENQRPPVRRQPSTSFDPRRPRVSIVDYSGQE
jgi:hypothetical protein